MKKIDLHQDIILSFEHQEDTFAKTKNHKDLTWRFGWWLSEYQEAELSLVFFALRPYIVKNYKPWDTFDSTPGRFNELLEQSLVLISKSNIWVIKKLWDLEEIENHVTNFLLHIEWIDFIKSLDQLKNVIEKWIRSVGFVRKYDNNFCWCSYSDKWLTALWKDAVHYLNTAWSLIDTAHMSDRAMKDVVKYSKKPVINSHSNILDLCDNKRNVTNSFLTSLFDQWWVLWLSVYDDFIVWEWKSSTIDDYLNQIQYLINMWWEDCLALGTDFHWLRKERIMKKVKSVKWLNHLEERIIDTFWSRIAEKFFFKNAMRVITENLPT